MKSKELPPEDFYNEVLNLLDEIGTDSAPGAADAADGE